VKQFRWLCAIGVLLCIPALSRRSLLRAQSQTTIEISTEIVVVDALVEQKKTGLPVEALKRDDLEIYEDGVRQTISQFSRDEVPLSIVFLFDMTDSVRPIIQQLTDGALASLNHLKAEDEVAVMLYAERADLAQSFTKDHAVVSQAIVNAGAMNPGHCGPTPDLCSQRAFFNEGIFQAAALAKKSGNPSNRRVIIWFTDNVPNNPDDSVHSEVAAFNLLRETGVVVCAVVGRSPSSYAALAIFNKNPIFALGRKKHPPGNANKYTEETGGVSAGVGRDDVNRNLTDLIDRVRSRYTIGYSPSIRKPEGAICRIEVKLSRDAIRREGAVEIRARTSYKR